MRQPSRHRPSVALLAALMAVIGAWVVVAPGQAAASPGEWRDPQAVDSSADVGADLSLVVGPDGSVAAWHRGGRTWQAHRAPGPDASWTRATPLSGSSGEGPVLAAADPDGGTVVLARTRHAGSRPTFSLWHVAPDGSPSPRREVPALGFRPKLLQVRDGQVLTAGTHGGHGDRARVAVLRPSGRWQVSPAFPLHRDVIVVAAWLDGRGRPHVLAGAVELHIPDTDQRRGAYPVYEAALRRDGSWGERDLAVRTFNPGGSAGAVSARGDVALAYSHENQRSEQSTYLRVRPAGSKTWGPQVKVRERYDRVALAIDADGTATAVRWQPGGPAELGRLDASGGLGGWQQLSNAAGGRPRVVLDGAGSAVVAVPLRDRDGPVTDRTWRCPTTGTCTAVGDFADPRAVLAASPDGQALRLAACDVAPLCSWWLEPQAGGTTP